MNSNKKTYNLNNEPESSVNEPAVAYTYATGADRGHLAPRHPATSYPETSHPAPDEQRSYVITKSGEKWFDITLEEAEELEQFLEDTKDEELYDWEDIKKEMEERSAARVRKHPELVLDFPELKKYLEYV